MNAVRAQDLLNGEVRAWLARKRMPQQGLAEALGVTQTQISARLRGDVDWKFDDLWVAAKFLGIPLSRIVAGIEDEAAREAAEPVGRSA